MNRTLRVSLAALAVATVAVVGAATAQAAPTLTIERACSYDQGQVVFSGVNIRLAGLPPFTPFHGTLDFPDDQGAEANFRTDVNGTFEIEVGFVSNVPGFWTATARWSGGTLTASVYVDCTKPSSKQDCSKGGWRRYGSRNQGQCISYVNRLGPLGQPPASNGTRRDRLNVQVSAIEVIRGSLGAAAVAGDRLPRGARKSSRSLPR